MEAKVADGLGVFSRALAGAGGPGQQRIASEMLRWSKIILAKNNDYGGSAWMPPILAPSCDAGDAILVRMSDKIRRLEKLLAGDAPPEITESIEDTVLDLGAYCLLWLARPRAPVPSCIDITCPDGPLGDPLAG